MACDEKNSPVPVYLLAATLVAGMRGKARIPGPQSDCLACAERRVHSAEENSIYHPFAAHGFTPETGWTDPQLPEIDRYGGYKKK